MVDGSHMTDPVKTAPTARASNDGHGHVTPRPDGVRFRCGGPGLCPDCSREAARGSLLGLLDDDVKPPAAFAQVNPGQGDDPALAGITADALERLHAGYNAQIARLIGERDTLRAQLDEGVQSLAGLEADRLRQEVRRLRAELDESDQLRDRMTQLLRDTAAGLKGAPEPLQLHDWSDLPAVAVRLRYERRLLGMARRTLDLVAAGDMPRWAAMRAEAEDVAQRIVDEIGHPVTDEEAIGPGLRTLMDTAWRLISHAEAPDYGGTAWIRTAAAWAEEYERLTGRITMASVPVAPPA